MQSVFLRFRLSYAPELSLDLIQQLLQPQGGAMASAVVSCSVIDPIADGAACVHWYAVYTKHQHEKYVALQLAGKGVETFLPLYQTTQRRRSHSKAGPSPIFPCYVFVRLDLQRKLDVLMTRGVFWFVGTAGGASPIPGCEMEPLRTLAANSARTEPHPYLTQGDLVRVCAGPLEGIEGIFVRSKGQCRVVLSIPLLVRSAAVEVDMSLLEKIPPRKMPAANRNGKEGSLDRV